MTGQAVRIVGRGVVSGAGWGVEPFWAALAAGLSLWQEHAHTAGDSLLSQAYVRVPSDRLAGDGEGTDQASRWLLAVCESALADAAAALPGGVGRLALVGATSLGGMSLYERHHRRWWDPGGTRGPGLPAADLPHARARYDGPLSHVAAELGGVGLTLNTACSSATNALGVARHHLLAGRVDTVLVAGFDVISPFVQAGFACLGAIADAPCRPFAADRTGLNLGEAALALVLSRSDAALTGTGVDLIGYGTSCDAHHLTRPDLSGAGLLRAIRAALEDAGLAAAAIDAVSAHGTATPFNDRMEAAAFAELFAEGVPPIHCAKPVFGHTLGAAGAIDALAMVEALRRGELPATRVDRPDPDLAVHPRTTATPLPPGGVALSTSSGFGGSNAAVILRQGLLP